MKLAIALSLFAALAACSWFGGEEGERPAELVDFDAAAKVRELWSVDTGRGPGEAFLRLTPAIQQDIIYSADTRGRVQAFRRTSGERQWITETGVPVTSGVGLGDDLVLVASAHGEVVALDKNTGHEQWRSQVSSEVLAPPAAAAGIVVIQSVDGHLAALAGANGKPLWNFERSEPALSLRGTATPIIVQDLVLTGFATGKLAAVSLREGRVIWEVPVGQAQGRTEIERLIDIDAPLLVTGRTLISAAYQGKVVAMSLENGRVLWSRELSSYSAMSADGGNLYLSDARGHVYALDLGSGATVWKQEKLSGRRPSAPVVVGNTVAVGDFEGYVHWLAREDGHFVARERAARAGILARPLVEGSALYITTQNGWLSALQLEPVAH